LRDLDLFALVGLAWVNQSWLAGWLAGSQDAWKRVCPSCGAEHFPRTDVVAITAVSSPDGQRCLLGRQKSWPPGLYSCLAGFLEPGESVAEGVAREVLEEARVRVTDVQLHSTQPWPCGPSPQLMMGCLSVAVSEDDVDVNKDELDDARWFARVDVLAALERCETEAGMRE
jgi:NAD+ diphosphatase